MEARQYTIRVTLEGGHSDDGIDGLHAKICDIAGVQSVELAGDAAFDGEARGGYGGIQVILGGLAAMLEKYSEAEVFSFMREIYDEGRVGELDTLTNGKPQGIVCLDERKTKPKGESVFAGRNSSCTG